MKGCTEISVRSKGQCDKMLQKFGFGILEGKMYVTALLTLVFELREVPSTLEIFYSSDRLKFQ